MKKPIITFARWGNYTIAFKSLFEQLGLEVIPPEKTNSQTIVAGAKIAPEMFCFPLKVTLGNYIPSLEKGANTIFMVQNVGGSCRQRYYGAIQEKVLKEAGYNIAFLDFRATPKDIYRELKIISGASLWQILKAIRFFFRKLRLIEKMEKMAQFYRPREIEKGATDKILQEGLLKLEELNEEKDFPKLKKEILKRLTEIKIEEKKELPRVALIGEIYTVCDPTINFDIEAKLGREGIEVHREMDITYHLKKMIFPWKDWTIQRKINPYLRSTVGGHGRDAIYEMLNYVKKDFDGIIHLLPFGCFVKDTNITVEGYLQKPIQEIKIGEKVLTHKGRFKKVAQTFRRNYQGKILKVDCGGKLLTFSLTPEHPILLAKTFTRGSRKKEIQNLDFVSANKTKKGDFIAIPIPKEIKKINYFEWRKEYKRKPKWEDIKKFPYSPELLRMLGYWLAEGTIRYDSGTNKKYKRGIAFHFASQEKNYIDDVAGIIKNNFESKISQYNRPDRPNIMELYIGNRNLGEIIFSLCGEHCDKKILHNDLMTLAPELQREILKGFFRGDGSFRDEYGETAYRGVTTSPNLASQLFWLLIRNRIKPSLMEQHIKNRKLSYMLKIATAHEIKRLNDENIKVTDRKPFIKHRELENYFLVPIRKIETINFRGKVYNLEVEDDHSYVANFMAVHNCMPEVTVRPILEKIHKESGIPFLSLSLDEQVAEAGISTRLEAFVDVVRNYYDSKEQS